MQTPLHQDLYGELPAASPPRGSTHRQREEEEEEEAVDDDYQDQKPSLSVQEPDTKKARISEHQR